MDDAARLDLAAELAASAASVILAIRARGFRTQTKPDESPVTEADHAAETVITRGLRRHTPHIPVVAEEEVAAGYAPPSSSELWLVDPLDGTSDFAAGRDSFCVNIGLVRDGRPVLGAVAIPATGELFGGRIGHGAWKREFDGRRPIQVRAAPASGLRVLASRGRAAKARVKDFVAGMRVAELVHSGSAIKFLRVAEGAADLYPGFGRTMEWDTAAPEAVLLAAGGSMTRLEGGLLRYGKPGWENPAFVCRGAQTQRP